MEGVAKKEMARRTGLSVPTVRKYLKVIEVGVSTRKLQRALKASLHLSPSGYIRTMRLQRAAQLLEGGVGNVSEVAYAVGFQDPPYLCYV